MAPVRPDLARIRSRSADAPHGTRGEDISSDSRDGDGRDGRPCLCAPGFFEDRVYHDFASFSKAGSGCSVSEGPLATKPTPQTISRIPSQR